jgi:CheY-like chemotaxis protein
MNNLVVLVVEDNDNWSKLLARTFERLNCRVDIAKDYYEAIEKLKKNQYDIVTLDMSLSTYEETTNVSISGGWELLTTSLKEQFPETVIYVISASFSNNPELAFKLNEHGVTDFMSKDNKAEPFKTIEEWVNIVKRKKQKHHYHSNEESQTNLLDIMNSCFNEEELKTICFKLGVDYEDLVASGRKNKARELIRYLNRNQRLNELVDLGNELRPNNESWQNLKIEFDGLRP